MCCPLYDMLSRFLRFKPFTLLDALTHVCKYLFLPWKKYIKIWIWSRTVNIPDNLTYALWFLHLNFKLLPSFTCIHVTNGKLLGWFSFDNIIIFEHKNFHSGVKTYFHFFILIHIDMSTKIKSEFIGIFVYLWKMYREIDEIYMLFLSIVLFKYSERVC